MNLRITYKEGIFMQSKHVLLRVMGILCLICFITIGSTGCGSDKYVDLVRESTMQMEPNIKIGKAFDQYFANGEWNSYETKQKDRIVEFKGGCTWGNEAAKCRIRFKITGKQSFELSSVAINGVTMNDITALSILDTALTGQ